MFNYQISIRISLLLHTCHMSCLSHSARPGHPDSIWWGVQIIQRRTAPLNKSNKLVFGRFRSSRWKPNEEYEAATTCGSFRLISVKIYGTLHKRSTIFMFNYCTHTHTARIFWSTAKILQGTDCHIPPSLSWRQHRLLPCRDVWLKTLRCWMYISVSTT